MRISLEQTFPPSSSCSCSLCTGYCRRPGWWTVREARQAIAQGYASRMMIEFSRDLSNAVLSPAFRGNESFYAVNENAANGCTFLKGGLCELYGTGIEPLECRYCHHERKGGGLRCHNAIGDDWNSSKGRRLVKYWCSLYGLELPPVYAGCGA